MMMITINYDNKELKLHCDSNSINACFEIINSMVSHLSEQVEEIDRESLSTSGKDAVYYLEDRINQLYGFMTETERVLEQITPEPSDYAFIEASK